MKFFLLFLFSAFLTAAAPLRAEEPAAVFNGAWHWEKGEESLDLILKQEGPKITGYHDAVGQQGMKVDAVEEPAEPSITGVIKGKVATVEFRSGFPSSTGGGTATLTLDRKYLTWKIVSSTASITFP